MGRGEGTEAPWHTVTKKSQTLGSWISENISPDLGEVFRKGAAGQVFVNLAQNLREAKEGTPARSEKTPARQDGAERQNHRPPRSNGYRKW